MNEAPAVPTTAEAVPPGPGRPAGPAAAQDRLLSVGLKAIQGGPALIVVALAIVFTIVNPTFLSAGNLSDLLVQATPILIIGFGQLVVIITRGIDLSVAAVAGFSSLVGWYVWDAFHPPGVLVVVAIIGTGAVCGLVNGVIIVNFRIANPFIVTLGSMYAIGGLSLLLTKGTPKQGQADLVVSLGSGQLGLFGLEVPMPIVVAIVVTVLVGLFLTTTRWGRWTFAVGGNPEGALRAGIRVNAVQVAAFVISGSMAGVGAVVLAGRVAGGDGNLAGGYELLTIAAVIIGGGSFFGGRGTIWNVVAGALIVIGIRNGLNLSGLDTNWLNIVVGAVLIVALGSDVVRRQAESAMRKRRARRAEGV